MPYQVYEYNQPKEDWEDSKEHFDGVTCDNRQLTVELRNDKDEITWDLNYEKEASLNQSTIQFWFKFGNKTYYDPRDISSYSEVTLFEMRHDKIDRNFWSVFMRDYYVS